MNHVSWMEIVVCAIKFTGSAVAKIEIFNMPFVGWYKKYIKL